MNSTFLGPTKKTFAFVFFFFFGFFSINVFLTFYTLISDLFFIGLSYSHDTDCGFGGLTQLARFFYPNLTFFSPISSFNIWLIEN